MNIVTPSLIDRILAGYSLPRQGIHGVAHWARVLENGRKLARLVDADMEIIELFAVFHDACRMNESLDHGHGGRGARLARELRGVEFQLRDDQFALLEYACREHTTGLTSADASVQVCWDADRLDLLRVGTRPRPDLLCTPAARESAML